MALQEFKVSVKNLVAFSCTQGDLDNRFLPSPSGKEGIAGHIKVQKSRPTSYQAERRFQTRYQNQLEVSGRADGVDLAASLVEEIKTTRVSAELIPDSVKSLHLAQAKIYAYMLVQEESLQEVQIQLTYYWLKDKSQTQTLHTCSVKELSVFFTRVCSAYLDWQLKLQSWRRQRNTSIRQLAFPFEKYRPGQKELAIACYRTLVGGKQLLCEAPTGIGKTLATSFPAIKAMGEEKLDTFFYLTSKNIGRKVVEDSIALLREKGLQFRLLTLTGRDKICFNPDAGCNAQECPYARGFYDKLDSARERMLGLETLNRSVIESLARELEICPYYMSMQLAPWVDAIVCDYNYAFDPVASFSWLMDEFRKKYALLIDEVHNLTDRARALYSESLDRKTIRALAKKLPDPLATKLKGVNRQMLALQKQLKEGQSYLSLAQPDSKLLNSISGFTRAFESYLADHPEPDEGQTLTVYFSMLKLQRCVELFCDGFLFELVKTGTSEFKVKVNCIDPALVLSQRYAFAHSLVAFSATVSPLAFTSSLLGFAQDHYQLVLPSPYPPENLEVTVCPVSTLYRDRDASLPHIAQLLHALWLQREGNYLVFFPSFQYLQKMADYFIAGFPDIPILCQQKQLSESEREVFLADFSDLQAGKYGFVVMGGLFGEGIDLPGEKLIGAVVVGVGLPQINDDSKRLSDYYQQQSLDGFAYAYQYPGLQKVIQAVGRVIRKDDDKGKVLLVDSRWNRPFYQQLMPAHWKGK